MQYSGRPYDFEKIAADLLEALKDNPKDHKLPIKKVEIEPFFDYDGDPALHISMEMPLEKTELEHFVDRLYVKSFASSFVRQYVGRDYGYLNPNFQKHLEN
jgi:hypothetical protein